MGPATPLNTLQERWPNGESTTSVYHQSNGLAEVYVKLRKAILQKAKDANEGSPPANVGIQDYTHFTNHTRPYGTHPCVQAQRQPSNSQCSTESQRHCCQGSQMIEKLTKSDENQLIKDKLSCTKPHQRKSGKKPVIKYVGHQSYLIHADDGVVYRCTRSHLWPYTPQQK